MPPESSNRRRLTYSAGHRAEQVAVLWLTLKGYRILARRFRVRGGELDIVAARGEIIAVVEVKARPTLDEARTAVTPLKLRRIERATSAWLSLHPWTAGKSTRGDLMLIAPRRLPRHEVGALALRL